ELSMEAYVRWEDLLHDVLVMDILKPGFAAWVDTLYQVRARVRNNGTASEDFDVEFLILTPPDTEYIDTASVTGLAGGGTIDVNFNNWIPAVYDNRYTVKAKTLLGADQNPANDEFVKYTNTYEYGEIAYDDFEQDGWWVVSSPNGPTDVFGQKLMPYFSPPYVVTKFKIYVNSSQPFDNVRLCPDNLGVPNFNSPFQTISSPNASNPPEWIVMNFDTTLTRMANSQPIWLCAQFANGASGPGVGSDQDPPFNLKSYWTSDLSAWNLFGEDWFMRVVHLPSVGVAEEASIRARLRTRLYQNSPNPFRRATDIRFVISLPVHASLKVYDISGGLVRTLESGTMEAGVHTVPWDGRDELGEDVGAGVYFYKLSAGDYNIAKKMVLLP
ncbi:MAG: FlgD immunoglobulin-like domain containing protein, partial [bacterium]